MKVCSGVFYFETFNDASTWAQNNGWPTEYIREYGLGFAVQACNSGRYAGPENTVWPGPVVYLNRKD